MKKYEKFIMDFVKSENLEQPTESFNSRYPKARIDINELSLENPNMKMNATYTVSIKKADNYLNGEWETKDFTINGNTITPLHTGECIVYYKFDGEQVLCRKIMVVE